MASEVYAFTVTLPPLVPPAAPVTVDVSFNPMTVERIYWRVPAGHVGQTGWRLMSGPGYVVPKNVNSWVVEDNHAETWELEDLHDSGSWQVVGYNTGNQPHNLFFRFHVSPISKRNEAPQQIPDHQLVSAADLSKAGPPINRGS